MIPVYALLLLSGMGVVFFALCGHKEVVGKWNTQMSGVSLLLTVILAGEVFHRGTLISTHQAFLIDAFNVYLIVLTAFVGFTTSLFSAPYLANEIALGKLSDRQLKLYYSMYQGFMLAMYLVL